MARPTENSGGTAGLHKNLRPWPKGQSGNPGGRPKGLAALVRAETDEGAELVAFMLDVLRGKRRAPTALRLQAVQWLADRGWGKATQVVEGSLTASIDATVSGLDEVRAEIRARLTHDDADAIARRLLDAEGPRDAPGGPDGAPGEPGPPDGSAGPG